MDITPTSAFFSFREFDNKSLELANGWMHVFESGTSTYVQLYSNITGTPRPNPVQLDGSGKTYFFGAPQACRVIINDVDGNQIDEADPVWLFGRSNAGNGTGSSAIVANYAELRALTQDYDLVTVLGYATPGDGGFGEFEHIAASTAPDNDGTVLIRQASSRYLRQYQGLIDPRWFGLAYGGTVDQMAMLAKALAVGPTQVQGYIYQNQDFHLGGTLAVLSGGFVSGATPKLYLDGKLIEGCAGMFSAGIQVVMGKSVASEIRTSWFSGIQQSLCTTYSYPYLVDADMDVAADLTVPYNYRADFPNGSMLQVSAAAKVDIANLVYTGNSQIIRYAQASFVTSVRVGQGACLLEWFGGIAGTAYGIDNTIPAKAAFAHGSVELVEAYYRVPNAGAAWVLGRALTIRGSNELAYNTLDLNQSVTATDLTTQFVNLTGASTITSTGNALIDHTTVPALDEQPSATTQNQTAAVTLPANYFVGGSAGLLRNSTDLTTWTPHTAGSNAIRGLAKGPVWIAVSDAGAAYRSVDGGTTWASISIGSATLYKVKWLQGQFVAIGAAGTVYVSTDGYTWNSRSFATSITLRDIAYSAANGVYVMVGTGASVFTSADLVSFMPRALPSGITGDLYAVACYANATNTQTVTIVSGALGGRYLIASDSVSYQALNLGVSDTIYSISTSPTTILLTGGSGNVYTSTSVGQQFTSKAVAGAAILSSAYSAGQWLIGIAGGSVWASVDLKTWLQHYTGVASDILAVSIGAPVYAVIGLTNTVQASPSGNGKDWKAVTVPGTGSWQNARVLNGLAFLVGAGGRVVATSDFVGFVTINTGTSTDLYDIAYNPTADRYVVVGAGGLVRWCTKADILSPTPTWTAVVTGTAATLTRAAWTGTSWIFSGSDAVVVSTDLSNGGTQTLAISLAGMLVTPITGGTLYILYGAGGLVLTSLDKLTWTKQITGTTANLRCGVINSGFAMIAGDTGVLIRADITNIATWASISVGTSNTINAINYNTGRSELGLCGAGGIAYRSTTNGVSWTAMATGSGQDMYGIWGQGTSWECVGAAGKWYTTSNGTTWTARTSNTSASIRCGTSNIAFGDAGYIGYFDSYVHKQGDRFGVTAVNFVAVANGTLLTSTGVTYQVAYGAHIVSGANSVTSIGISGNAGSTATSLTFDSVNGTMHAVGGAAFSASVAAAGYMDFVPVAIPFAGVRDVQYSGGWIWAVGDNGLVAKTNNGYIWTTQALRGDTTQRLSVPYYLATSGIGQKPGITGYTVGALAVMTGVGGKIYAGAGALLPLLALATSEISYSTIQAPVTSSVPAVVRNSSLRSLDKSGAITDSTITDGLAAAYGNILRSTVNLFAPLSVVGDILISEDKINKTAAWDRSGVLFGSIAGAVLQIDATNLEYTGLLVYSEDAALKVKLNACSNSSNFAGALSNGYAKVYLANCNAAQNPSAYSIDGETLDANVVSLGASQEITGALTDWSGLPAGTTTDTHKLTLTAAATLGPSATGPTTLRWHGTSNTIKQMQNAGGRIKVEVVYPTGFTPNPLAQLRVAMVKPQLALLADTSAGGLTWQNPVNDALMLGAQAPVPVSKTAGKLVTYANVYGGYADIYQLNVAAGTSRQIVDPWTDNSALLPNDPATYQAPWANSSVVVIWASADLALPVGTTIQVTLLPVLPRTVTELQRWYNAIDRTLDPYQNAERQQLAFEGMDATAGLTLAYTPVAGASTSEDVKWLSLFYNTFGPNIDTYTADGVNTIPHNFSYAVIPTNKALLWTGLASIGMRVRLLMAALADTTWHSVNGGNYYQLGAQANGKYIKFDGYDITAGTWKTLTVDRVTLP